VLAADQVGVQKGFKVEMLYNVPKAEQGSWVSMTVDPRGRILAGDQYGTIYRVTVPPVGSTDKAKVEPLGVQIGGAHGLLYAFNSLYVMINGAMVMGLAPVVGVPMPMLSYGGTVMLTVMIGFGLVQSVRVHRYAEVTSGKGSFV
jgi:hypothetical protein